MKEKSWQRRRGRWVLLALLVIVAVAIAYYLISGYVKTLPSLTYEYYTGEASPVPYPDAQFAVLSDLHYYDCALGTEGAAFAKDLNADRKLLTDSGDLLNLAVSEIEKAAGLSANTDDIASKDTIANTNDHENDNTNNEEKIDNETFNADETAANNASAAGGEEEAKAALQFVLVSGDLTKDGERINHEHVASRLQQLVDRGIQVFVVPGNHDINNPGAVRYVGDGAEPTDTVTADEFAQIYANMGFGDALMRDEDSLSYVAEPVEGLWLVAVDSCRYRENQPGKEEIISGKINQTTEHWLADVLGQAVSRQKAVMVLMHHGVVEHWDGQAKLHPDYLIRDYPYFGRFLASYNVKLAFTGHYHAQDITLGEFARGSLYDVETGSLITPSCPIRFCGISDNTLTIESAALVDKLHPGTDFAGNGLIFARDSVIAEAYNILRSYKVSEADSHSIAATVGDAYMAHYSGDEDPALRPSLDESKLSLWGRLVYSMQKYVVDGLWADLPSGDKNVILPL